MAKKTKTTKTKAQKATRGFAPEAKITVAKGTENPLRQGSVHYRGFEALRTAGTYANFTKTFKTTESEPHAKILHNAVARGFAKVGA